MNAPKPASRSSNGRSSEISSSPDPGSLHPKVSSTMSCGPSAKISRMLRWNSACPVTPGLTSSRWCTLLCHTDMTGVAVGRLYADRQSGKVAKQKRQAVSSLHQCSNCQVRLQQRSTCLPSKTVCQAKFQSQEFDTACLSRLKDAYVLPADCSCQRARHNLCTLLGQQHACTRGRPGSQGPKQTQHTSCSLSVIAVRLLPGMRSFRETIAEEFAS